MITTAQEVAIQSDIMAKKLGETYGRLQEELLSPLVKKMWDLSITHGHIPLRTEFFGAVHGPLEIKIGR